MSRSVCVNLQIETFCFPSSMKKRLHHVTFPSTIEDFSSRFHCHSVKFYSVFSVVTHRTKYFSILCRDYRIDRIHRNGSIHFDVLRPIRSDCSDRFSIVHIRSSNAEKTSLSVDLDRRADRIRAYLITTLQNINSTQRSRETLM